MTAAAPSAGRPARLGFDPTGDGGRITNLDAVRGVAVLGILPMNAVMFGLAGGAIFNLDLAGSVTPLDWVIGVAGEVFVDQKFMGLFSMLFGAGIVLFADRAQSKGRRPVLLSLWRNGLLFVIGVLHSLVWEGDILTIYATAAPFLLMVRKRRPRHLLVAGVGTYLIPVVIALAVQPTIDASGTGLGEYWYESGAMSDGVGVFFIADYFFRAVGMMLIGVALYRLGIITGESAPSDDRRMAVWGLGFGLPLAIAGVAWMAAAGFSPSVALVGSIPNTLGTIPVTIGYLALITLWNRRSRSGLRDRIHAVGRMALTNYLSQSVLGVVLLGVVLNDVELTRTGIVVFVGAVWALQLWWSPVWLNRFQFGPVEWLWRSATYLSWQPLRRTAPDR